MLCLPSLALATSSISTILVVGDSLSAAYGIPPEQGWVSLLEKRLEDNKYPYHVVNVSISGNTSSNGLTSLPQALKQYKPSIVIIGLGSNDGLRGLSTVAMQSNLSQMVELAKKTKARVLLAGFLIPVNYGPIYRKKFEHVFETVSDEYHLPRIPFLLEKVVLKPELIQNDGLHPNEAAQPLILDTVWPFLEKMLSRSG